MIFNKKNKPQTQPTKNFSGKFFPWAINKKIPPPPMENRKNWGKSYMKDG